MDASYAADVQRILAQRHHLGWDYWTTIDHRLNKGGIFSLMSSLMLLNELEYPKDELIMNALALVWAAQRPDGRFKLSPDGSLYPCQTIHALLVLSAWGEGNDPRLAKTIDHVIATQEPTGGWRCRKFSYGKGPETLKANPGPTLSALMAFTKLARWTQSEVLKPSVQFLLDHWDAKIPWGPCHYGMGSLFHQVEYPFQTYNLFSYVYTLSFYPQAQQDPRFLAAYERLRQTLREDQIVVQRTHPKLANFAAWRQGEVSIKATQHWKSIQHNRMHE